MGDTNRQSLSGHCGDTFPSRRVLSSRFRCIDLFDKVSCGMCRVSLLWCVLCARGCSVECVVRSWVFCVLHCVCARGSFVLCARGSVCAILVDCVPLFVGPIQSHTCVSSPCAVPLCDGQEEHCFIYGSKYNMLVYVFLPM